MARITIPLGIDDSDANAKLSQIQNKLKSLREGGAYSQISQEYRSRGDEQAAQRLEKLRDIDRQRTSSMIQKDLDERFRKLDKINNKEQAIQNSTLSAQNKESALNKISAERLKIVNDIADKQTALNKLTEEGSDKASKLAENFTKVSAVVGAIGTALQVAIRHEDFLNRRLPGYRDVRAVSLSEQLYQPSERAMRGESARDIIFAPERARALKGATQFGIRQEPINQAKYKRTGVMGTAGIVGGLGLLAYGLAPFTGGISALGYTAALGAIGGGAAMLASDEGLPYEALFGDKGEITKKTMQQALERRKQIEAREKYGTLDKIKRTKFLEYISEPGMFNNLLNLRRRSGMGEQQFLNDYFIGRGMRGSEDFIFRERAGMTQQIMAGGGSAAAGFNQNLITALQAQRGFGITNAGQAMGRLASYMTAQESDDAFKRILSSAFSDGLDDSKKLETYLDAVTSIAQNIGGGEESVARSIAQMMGPGATVRDVQAAAGAYGTAADIFSKQEGPTAVARARFISTTNLLSGMSGIERQSYQNLRYDQIEANNPQIQAAFEAYKKKTGDTTLSINEYVDKFKKGFRDSVTEAYQGTNLGSIYAEIVEKIDEKIKTKEYEEASPEERRKMLAPLRGRQMNILGIMAPELMFRGFKEKEAFARTMGGEEGLGEFEGIPSQEEYEQMKFNQMALTPEEQKKFQAAQKFYEKPGGALEGIAAGMGVSQRRLFESVDISGIMGDLAKNMSSNLDSHLKEKLILNEFNKALNDGAKEAMEALKNVIIKEWPEMAKQLLNKNPPKTSGITDKNNPLKVIT